MAEKRVKQECPHCNRLFTIGAGLSRHKRACQYGELALAGDVIDMMVLLQEALDRDPVSKGAQ